jgi:hypothetical protein
MEETTPQPVIQPTPKRPLYLTVLCILTFIGSGMNMISSLLIFIFFDAFQSVGENITKTFDLPGIDVILNARPVFFAVSVVIYGLSAFGAYQMWKLIKHGFHIYTIAQILLIIVPMYFFKLSAPSFADIILSGIFVALYSANLKHMS